MKINIVLVLLLFIVISCKPKITKGIVVNKQYVASKDSSSLEYDFMLDIPMIKTKHYPEEYHLTIKDSLNIDVLVVTKEKYNSVQISDSVNIN